MQPSAITGRLIDAAIKILEKTSPPQTSMAHLQAHLGQQLEKLSKTCSDPDHPPYASMIRQAIEELNEEGGSDEEAISKIIKLKYQSLPWGHTSLLSHHLKKLSNEGEIVRASDDLYKLPPQGTDATSMLKQKQKRKKTNLQKEKTSKRRKLSKDDVSQFPETEGGYEQKGAVAEPEGVEERDQLQEKQMQVNELPNPLVNDFPSQQKGLGINGSEEVHHVSAEQGHERAENAVEDRAQSQEQQAQVNELLKPVVTDVPSQICQVFEEQEHENLEGADQVLGESSLAVEGERNEGHGEEALEDLVDRVEMEEFCQRPDKQNQEDEGPENVMVEKQNEEQPEHTLVETQSVELENQQDKQTTVIGPVLQLQEIETEIEGIENLMESHRQQMEGSKIADNRKRKVNGKLTCPSLREIGTSISSEDNCLDLLRRTNGIRKCLFEILKSVSDANLDAMLGGEGNETQSQVETEDRVNHHQKSEICVPVDDISSHSMARSDHPKAMDVMLIEAQHLYHSHKSEGLPECVVTALKNLSLRQEKRQKLSEQQEVGNLPSTSSLYSQQPVGERGCEVAKSSEANFAEGETVLSNFTGGNSSISMPLAAPVPALEKREPNFQRNEPAMPDLSKDQQQEATLVKVGKKPDFEIRELRQETLTRDMNPRGPKYRRRPRTRAQHKHFEEAKANAVKHQQLKQQQLMELSVIDVIDEDSPMKAPITSGEKLEPLKPADELENLFVRPKESITPLQNPIKLSLDGQESRSYKTKLRPRATASLPEPGPNSDGRVALTGQSVCELREEKKPSRRGRPPNLKPEMAEEAPRKRKAGAGEEPTLIQKQRGRPKPKSDVEAASKEVVGSACPSPQQQRRGRGRPRKQI